MAGSLAMRLDFRIEDCRRTGARSGELVMARLQEFDSDDVLEAAMQLFWSKGYGNTSLDDLVRATGLSRSSLYNSFGSKHDLFLSAVDRYNETAQQRLVERLESGIPVRRALKAMLTKIVEGAVSGRDKRGCLLCNTANELAAQDRDAAIRVATGFRNVEDALFRAIKGDQRAGDIPPDRNPRAIARFVVSSINGLRAVAKARPDRAYLADVVRTILSVLD